MAKNRPGQAITFICKKLLIVGLAFAFFTTPFSSLSGAAEDENTVPNLNAAKDPPYNLNARKINAGTSIDGDITDPVWSHPDVARAHTQDFGGYILNISAFFNDTSVVISVQLFGDDAQNPNDWCAVCFDSNFNGGSTPDSEDVKVVAKNTKTDDEYELYHGDGVGDWTLYSDDGGSPNPWPSGYAADAEIDCVATYEFAVPIADVWGNGKLAGFIVHTYDQGEKHVWWPDASYDGLEPPTDPCNTPSGYGEIICNAPQVPRTKTLYLHDDGAYVDTDDWELMNTSLPSNPANINYENGGYQGIRINRGTDPTIQNRLQCWNLTPPLASDLYILDDVNLTLWTRCNVGASQPKNMTFALMDSNGTKISTGYYNRSMWPTTFFKTNITIPVTAYTIIKGQYLWLNISRTDITGQSIYIMFDNDTCPSHLNITTDSYVDVNWTKCYNSGWTETYDYNANEEIRVLSNLTDPFGSYDIVNATFNVTGPGGATLVSTQPMNHLLTDASNPSAWKLYNYTIATPRPAGMYRINVTAWESNGVTQMRSVFFNVTGVVLTADHLVYVSGDGQTGAVDTNLAQPIKVKAVDQAGIPVPGSPVNFTIYSWPADASNQEFVPSGTLWFDAVTNATGVASAQLHLGTKPGVYWVNASNPGLPGIAGPRFINTLDATATVGPLATLQTRPNPTTVAPLGTSAVTVWANDSFGNGITGLTVAMAFYSNPSAPGASLASPATDNADGTYSSAYTAGSTGGVVDVVNATSGGIWGNATVQVGTLPLAGLEISSNVSTVQVTGTAALTIWANDTLGTGISGLAVNMAFDDNQSGAGFGAVTDNLDGTYSCIYTAGQSAPATDKVNATSGGFWAAETINVVPGNIDTLEMSASTYSVAPGGSSALTVWANDSFDNGIPELTVTMTFDANPSGAGFGAVTDNLDGTYSSTYTAGATGGVTDTARATESGSSLFDTVDIDVSALPLFSIQMSSDLFTVQVTGAAALTIWANDTGGGGMAGQTIILSFAPNLSGAFLTGVSEIGGGVYSATYTAGQTAWVTDTVKASCGGKEDTVSLDVEAGVPSDLVYVSGDGQKNNVSQVLSAPFIVQAFDAYGNVVPGTPVSWAIATFPAGATGQSLIPGSNATDATGLSGTRMTLGNLPGWYNATATSASVLGDSVSFSAECLPPPVIPQVYSIFLVTGNNQSGSISSVLPLPLTIEVRNQTSVPASGVRVWFNVTGGGGSLSAATADTGANGRASTTLTLGPAAGLNRVTAQISAGGTKTVTFTANATAPELAATLAANVTSVVAGQSVMYIINFGNSGTEAAKDVRLNFTLRSGLSYISDTSGSVPAVTQTALAWTFDSAPEGQNSFTLVCGVGAQMSGNIQTHFDVNYSSQSGIEQTAVRSNSVTLNVLQEAQANVPPVIEGVPDLTVHYDWDYRIDLAPYITDPDNAVSELVLILSDNVHARVDPAGNTAIILNYSQDLVGISQTLNITVSDGYGSDWDSITVTVSDDFPPELVGIMPDITFNEDTVHHGFNITHYFFDRDGDSLIYTYGERHLTVTIMDVNSTVQIVPELNWYGQETITFRALDPTGALVEDTVLVTVNPVNDPPVATVVPDQVGRVNVTWVLDLSPYLSDVDNTLNQLILSVDSEYATVNGLNLTFRCAVSVNDILTVTVSDGSAQTYVQINILAEYPPATPESLPSWVLPLVVIIAIALLLLLAAAMRKPVIEQAFLIYKDGALLAHTTNRMVPDMDTQIFSSMFTAIQDFIKDSFKDEKDWSLNKLEFGDNKIFIARGKEGLYSLSLIYRGRDRGLQSISKKAIEAIDKAYGKEFKDWDGNMDRFRGVRDVLSDSIFK